MFPIPLQPLVALAGAILLGVVVEQAPRPLQAAAPPAPPPRVKRLSETEIERLIANLGNEDYRERESATQALKWHPEAAPALLRANRATENPEMKQRLASILSAIMNREAEKRLACLPEYVKHRQIDRLVETMVANREFITADHDKHVQAFVKDVFVAAIDGKKLAWTDDISTEIATFAWHNRPDRFRPQIPGPTMVARTALPLSGRGTGVIASDRIEGDGRMHRSVALCNGDIDVSSVSCSMLITTGTIRAGISGVDNVVIVSLGDVELGSGSGAVIVTAGRLTAYGGLGWMDKEHSIIRERDKEFFSTWKLYSATEAGATLQSAYGLVWVLDVATDTPFAKAGIKPGDILTRVDGNVVHSIRDTNRLLCRATVSSGVTQLSIVRGNTKRDVIVTLYEW